MKRRRLVVALTVVVLLAALTPAAGQDAVKAEIRQAIDAAYLNAYWNGMDITAFLAGWDHGAISPMVTPKGDVASMSVMSWIAGAVRANRKPPEKKEFTFLYPVIDVTGNMAMAKVEVMRGEAIRFTDYFPVVKTRTGWKIVGYPYYFHRNGVRPETPAGEADAVKKVVEDALVRGLLQDGTYEQARAGIAPVCDVNLYLPEIDVVTKLDLAQPFMAKSDGVKLLPIKTSAFTLVGITGDVAAGKLAVTFDSGTVMTMYVALYKLKTGWAIVQIATDKGWESIFPPPPAPPGPPPPRDFSRLSGPYLGQTPPGATPQAFAPNAVSTTARELNSVFTPDGREFYFTVEGEDGRWTIMRSALEEGRWTPPKPASFSGRWSDVDLFITADGRQLYFCSNRPLQGSAPKDFDIWVCDRAGSGWSEPRNLGAPINSPAAEFYPTLTRDGTMYFQSQRPGGHGAADIWRARLRDGKYVGAECLPGPVNTSGFEGDALIAPDESYLIVSTRVGTTPSSGPTAVVTGAAVPAGAPPPPPPPPPTAAASPASPPPSALPGLFLSVPRADGSWSPLVSLGDAVNTPQAGVNCQMLSPDGRYLFFTRGGDIYWVDAAVLLQAKERALEAR